MTLGKFTYGAELEWSDIKRNTELSPELGTWNLEDETIVNSDGRPNDPKGKKNDQGGEINTTPTDTIDEQIYNIFKLKELLNPVSNYRANLHVHIGVQGLKEDLDALKGLLRYICDNELYIYNEMLYKQYPTHLNWSDPNDLKLAKDFHRQQIYWAKRPLAVNRIKECFESTSPHDFNEAQYCWSTKLNKRLYHLASPRAGINLRSIFKHGSVEFRIYPGTVDIQEIRDCFEFADEFISAGLFNPERTSKMIYESRTWKFPPWQPFNPELERKYRSTKPKVHPLTGEDLHKEYKKDDK